MGSILVIASSKGGAAKTTLTTALAVNLAGMGYSVAVVDADRNQAFVNWHRIADAPPLAVTSCIGHNEIVGHVIAQSERHDVVLVDSAGFENQTATFAMGPADMVLIPCMPDRNSVIEAAKTAKQVQSVSQIARRSIPYRVILSRWNPKGLAESATLEDLEATGLPRINQHVSDLVAFQKSTYSGDMPRTGNIGRQIGRIIEELRALEALGSRPAGRAA
jgi:chromosome partitioning protein